MRLENFVLLRNADEKFLKTFCNENFNYSQIINTKLKGFAFFWPWQAMDNCVIKSNCHMQFDFIKAIERLVSAILHNGKL